MATYTWSIPSGKEINGSTKIKDTDNKISDTIDDLVDFVNGEGNHLGQGLSYDLVDKASNQTITGDKIFSGSLTGSLTGNADTSSACTGNSATATTLSAGADRTKLDGIETGATADQTGAEIKAAYEGEANTNAFTDADHSKLDGIEAGAEVNVQSDWNATSGDAQILNKPATPTITIQAASTAIGGDTTVTLPSNAIMLQGYASIYGGGNAGARLSAQIKNSGGTIIDSLDLCGTNYTNGSDGGSGMIDSHSFCVMLPSTAHSVRFYRSSGSQGISGTINQYMIYS